MADEKDRLGGPKDVLGLSQRPDGGDSFLSNIMFGNIDGVGDLSADITSWLPMLQGNEAAYLMNECCNDQIKDVMDEVNTCQQHTLAPEPGTTSTRLTIGRDHNNNNNSNDNVINSNDNAREMPLSSVLPLTFEGKTVHDLFPDFDKNKGINFSKLFASANSKYEAPCWPTLKRCAGMSVAAEMVDEEITDDLPTHALEMIDLAKQSNVPIRGVYPTEDQIKQDKLEQWQQLVIREDTASALRIPVENRDMSESVCLVEEPGMVWYTDENIALLKKVDQVRKMYPEEIEEANDMYKAAEVNDYDMLPVKTYDWENDVILDWSNERAAYEASGNDLREIVKSGKFCYSGWIPTSDIRTLADYRRKVLNLPADFLEEPDLVGPELAKRWQNIFPPDNQKLIEGDWEKNVIFDLNTCPLPTVPHSFQDHLKDANLSMVTKTTDGEEDPVEDVMLTQCVLRDTELPVTADRVNSMVRKTNRRAGLRASFMQESNASASKAWLQANLRHQPLAAVLDHRLFPGYFEKQALLDFHRPRLGVDIDAKPIATSIVNPHHSKKSTEMTVLLEYMEEYPLLLSQPGMGVALRNYVRKSVDDTTIPVIDKPEFGAPIMYVGRGPLLGNLPPSRNFQIFENFMFRAPAARHSPSRTDFLLTLSTVQPSTDVTKKDIISHFSITRMTTTFAVGQQIPQIDVPMSGSKKANTFQRDHLHAHVLRELLRSEQTLSDGQCPFISFENIRRVFASMSDVSIRKKIRQFTDLKRKCGGNAKGENSTGGWNSNSSSDGSIWHLRGDVAIPSEDEIRAVVTPERCCAFYSMLACDSYLKEYKVTDKTDRVVIKDDSQATMTCLVMQAEMDCAPWNTTRNFLDSLKDRCTLQIDGLADPTGRGLGYSFTRTTGRTNHRPGNARQVNVDDKCEQPSTGGEKQTTSANSTTNQRVTGTDADLRRLRLKDAKKLLIKEGIAEQTVKSLSRWEIINVVRTMSVGKNLDDLKTEAGPLRKFARTKDKYQQIDMANQCRQKCQRVFDAQLKLIEGTPQNASLNEKLILGSSDGENSEAPEPRLTGLKITRHYKDPMDGKETCKVEYIRVTKSTLEEYARIRSTMTVDEIRKMVIIEKPVTKQANTDKQHESKQQGQSPKTEGGDDASQTAVTKGLKRKLTSTDRVSRKKMKKNDITASEGGLMGSSRRSASSDIHQTSCDGNEQHYQSKVKCGACGATGHMRTNRDCPAYGQRTDDHSSSRNEAINIADEKPESCSGQYSLRAVGGTKFIFCRSKQDASDSSNPTATVSLTPDKQNEQRIPAVASATAPVTPTAIFTPTTATHTAAPIKDASGPMPLTLRIPKSLAYYSTIPEEPIRISLVAKKPPAPHRSSASSSPAHHHHNQSSGTGERKNHHGDYSSELKLSKGAHRRRVDPKVSLSVIFEKIVKSLRELNEARMFLMPVSSKDVPDYQTVVKNPVDLQTICTRAKANQYTDREMFLRDIKYLVDNSVLYNGADSPITKDANVILNSCVQKLTNHEKDMMLLEKLINPLLDDDDLVGLSFIFSQILDELLKVENAWQFLKPVSKTKYPAYYQTVKNPIDFETIKSKIESRAYRNQHEFKSDIRQLYTNSKLFNGNDSEFTRTALILTQKCEQFLDSDKYKASIEQLCGDKQNNNTDLDLFGEISDDSDAETS